jgi:diacylglycerol O-acyltransferase / wax synthase
MQRMSGIDPMFVYSATPVTPMEVAYACVFDPKTAPGGYSFQATRDVLADRVPALVPFRRRLMPVPFGLDHPRWVDDPDFDLDNHLHRVALPAPGGEAELAALVAAIMGRPLDPDQPPWEMHIVEGIEDGKVGLIAKIHHAVIDGVAGIQLMAQLLDLSQEGRPSVLCAPWVPAALPSSAHLVAAALPGLFKSPVRALKAAREVGRTTFRLARCALDGQTGPVSIPLGAPRTFETPVGAERSVSFAKLNLRDVRSLKEQFGVTINDVVLAVCSGALRSHLVAHEEEVSSPLVAVVPVSVRGESADGDLGNRLSAMFIPLANDLEQPLERLRAVAETSTAAKAQERAVGYGPLASAVSEALPPVLARPMVQLGIQVGALRRLRAGNLMISNVRGSTRALYFAGMRMVAAYPLGPVVDGVALNITVQSYGDSVFVGINACANAVPDLPGFARAIGAELDHLTDAAVAAHVAASKAACAAAHPSIYSGQPSHPSQPSYPGQPSHSGQPSHRPRRTSPVAVLLGEVS